MPSTVKMHNLANQHDLQLTNSLQFGDSYVKTLYAWLDKFDSNYKNIKKLGFDDTFVRMWRFYLAYCIAGFAVGRTNVGQFTYR